MSAESAPRRPRRHLVVAATWIALVVAYQMWAWRSGLGPAESARRLVDALQGGTWGPVIYTAVYVLRPLLLFSAAALTVAGGFLFGPWLGLAVVLLASNASALLAHTIGRWFGADGLADGHRLQRYTTRLRSHSFETIVVLRLLLLPYDLVSYLSGFLRIRVVPFIAGTALGGLPGTVAFVLFGASVERFDGGVPSLDTRILAASVAMLAVSLVLVRVVRRREGAADAA